MVSPYEKIKELRKQKGLSQDELARLVGYNSRSTVNKIEQGKVDLPHSKIINFARALGVTPQHLLGWDIEDTPMIGNNLKKYRMLSQISMEEAGRYIGVSRQTIFRYENGTISNIPSNKIEKLAELYGVTPSDIMGWTNVSKIKIEPTATYPYIPEPISAGIPDSIVGLSDLPTITIPDILLKKYARNKNIVIMTVNGESMNRIIPNGSNIAVLTNIDWQHLKDGDIVVFSHNGEYSVKQIYTTDTHLIFRPMSTDITFTDYIIEKENADDLKIFGKVVMYSVSIK